MSDYYVITYNKYNNADLIGAGYIGRKNLNELSIAFDEQVIKTKTELGDNCCLADLRITKL